MRCFTALSLSSFSIAMTVDVATLAGRLVLYFREVISSNNSCAYHSNRGQPFGKLLLYILMASISSSSSFVSSFFIVHCFLKTLQRYYKKSYYANFQPFFLCQNQKKMRSRFSRRAAAVVIKITQIAYDRIKQIFDRKNGGRTHGAFRPPAGVPKPRSIAIDGRNGWKGLRVSLPPVGVP